MFRRALLTAVPLVLVLGACGSTDSSTSSPPTDPTTNISGLQPSDDADVALVRLGGSSSGPPELVIGGDRWVYSATADRATPAGFARMAPPPLAPRPYVRRRLSEAGLEKVLGEAARLGLLGPSQDDADPDITDAGSTVLTLEVGGTTFEHAAYALGYQEETGGREKLQRFVEMLGDLEGFVGVDDLGPEQAWIPARFVVEELTSYVPGKPSDPERMWPAGVPIDVGCIELPIDEFPAGVAGSYVTEDDIGLEVLPDLPGDICT